MKDFLVSTTGGLLQSIAVIDLVYQEEKRQNCEFVVVWLQKAQKIAYISLQCNKINLDEFERLMDLTVKSCQIIAIEMRKAVKKACLAPHLAL